jgi:nucleotide-binding universal stress UspA family protein
MNVHGPHRVVVGVDGSPNSVAALRFAAEEARLRHAELHVVHAWNYNPAPPAFAPMPSVGPSVAEQEEAAGRVVAACVAEALGDDTDVTVVETVVNAPAAEALRDAATGADLLVVGARGHAGLLGVVLGSIAVTVVKHAPCAVVVVPAPARDDAEHPLAQQVPA